MPVTEAPRREIVLRATAVHLILAIALSVVPKRNAGSLSPNDLLALVVSGALTADAISAGAESTTDRIAQDSPTLPIHDGRILERNLRREPITEEELAASLRKQGIVDLRRVKQAVVEVDGEISTVQVDPEE